MHIDYLAEHVELVPSIAQWHLEEWGHLHPDDTLDDRIAVLGEQLNQDRVPMVLVALSGSAPIGTVSLLDNDLPERSHLGPWVANLFVPEELRRQGIGSALVKRVVEEGWKLGYETLYSVTWDHHERAKTAGWRLVEQLEVGGRVAAVIELSRRDDRGSAL